MNILEYAMAKKLFGGSGGGINVSGTKLVKENGEFDIAKYAKVKVDVPMPTNSVIGVDELPTENINQEAVYIYKGDLYRYSERWEYTLKDTPQPLGDTYQIFEIPFVSAGLTFSALSFSVGSPPVKRIGYITNDNATLSAYVWEQETMYGYKAGWSREEYKTIAFLEKPTDETLIAWLDANATSIMQAGWNKYTLTTEGE